MNSYMPVPKKKEMLWIANNLEEMELSPANQRIDIAKGLNRSIGYEVIRWNKDNNFWLTSYFFNYYLYYLELEVDITDRDWFKTLKQEYNKQRGSK